MSPQAGMMLVKQVLPLIGGAIGRGVVKPVGCEDAKDLKAEGIAIAAAMLDAAEQKGKPVTPGNIAFYAIQSLRVGRRSGYAGNSDVMSAGARMAGHVIVTSMDEPRGTPSDDPEGEITLHDFLADPHEDAGAEAGRRIDWENAVSTMDSRMQGVVEGTAQGISNQEIAAQYGISAPRCCQVREAAAHKIAAAWGGNPVVDATQETAWAKHVRAYAQRRACRAERAGRMS